MVATLKGTEYDTGLDLEKLSEAAKHFRTVADRLKRDGFLDPKVLSVDTNTLIYQVPGGMLSNLISQLKQANAEDKYYDVLAEVPRVRKDFGYPPLVTPTSQIVGSQAVLNVLAGERYKMFTKESKAVLRGEYGRLPGKVNEAVRKKAIGNDKVITCRPADLLKPELDTYRKELGDLAQSEEDVLSYALFPQVAKKFFEARRDGTVPSGADKTVSPAPASAKPAASAASRPTQREVLVVEDLTEDTPFNTDSVQKASVLFFLYTGTGKTGTNEKLMPVLLFLYVIQNPLGPACIGLRGISSHFVCRYMDDCRIAIERSRRTCSYSAFSLPSYSGKATVTQVPFPGTLSRVNSALW